MNYLISIILMTATFTLNAQIWQNLEYNEYQHGLEHNPLRGYATMWDVHTTDPSHPDYIPYSIQGKLFKFNEILTGYDSNTGEYIYNWAVVENFLEEQGNLGKHAYLQINIDPVKNGVLDLPQFILDSLNIPDPITGLSNLIYVNDTVLPNWNHPVLMDAMVDLIEKFGAEYNNDNRVFLVHMGLYGMWGEWHIFPYNNIYPHLEMNQANRDILANAFETSFNNKELLARYPASFSNPQNYGYSDGLFFEHSIGTPSWYFQNILNDSGASENWKNHPIGGEVSPILQDTLFDAFPNVWGDSIYFAEDNSYRSVQRGNTTLKALHTTWLFSHYLFRNPADTDLTQRERNNAKRLQLYLGYRFYLKQYKTTALNGILKLEAKVQNQGVAPIYENWDTELAVIDANGTLRKLKKQQLDLHTILPSSNAPARTLVADSALSDGNYTVLIRVINPLEEYSNNAPPVRFANRTQDMHLKGWLTIANITIIGGVVTQSSQLIADGPYGGENAKIPGNIEGEAYNNGGQGIAFHDNDTRIGDSKYDYRPYDAVDVVRKADGSNGFVVGYATSGEWLNYTVDIEETGYYELHFNYFCGSSNTGQLRVTIDGSQVATIGGIQNFSNWNARGTIMLEDIYLEQGTNRILRLEYVNGGNFDIDNLVFNKQPLIADGEYAIKSVSGAYLKATGLTSSLNSTLTNMSDSTKWNLTHLGDDVYRISSVMFNDNRLEVPFGNCNAGLSVATTWYTGPNDHLKWKVSLVNGKLMFEPMHCLGNALDVEITQSSIVNINTKDTSNNDQLFELVPNSGNVSILSMTEADLQKSLIEVYPNPTTDLLNIRIPNGDEFPSTIQLFDVQGRLIHSFTTSDENTVIRLESMTSETIILVRVTNTQQSDVFRVIRK